MELIGIFLVNLAAIFAGAVILFAIGCFFALMLEKAPILLCLVLIVILAIIVTWDEVTPDKNPTTAIQIEVLE